MPRAAGERKSSSKTPPSNAEIKTSSSRIASDKKQIGKKSGKVSLTSPARNSQFGQATTQSILKSASARGLPQKEHERIVEMVLNEINLDMLGHESASESIPDSSVQTPLERQFKKIDDSSALRKFSIPKLEKSIRDAISDALEKNIQINIGELVDRLTADVIKLYEAGTPQMKAFAKLLKEICSKAKQKMEQKKVETRKQDLVMRRLMQAFIRATLMPVIKKILPKSSDPNFFKLASLNAEIANIANSPERNHALISLYKYLAGVEDSPTPSHTAPLTAHIPHVLSEKKTPDYSSSKVPRPPLLSKVLNSFKEDLAKLENKLSDGELSNQFLRNSTYTCVPQMRQFCTPKLKAAIKDAIATELQINPQASGDRLVKVIFIQLAERMPNNRDLLQVARLFYEMHTLVEQKIVQHLEPSHQQRLDRQLFAGFMLTAVGSIQAEIVEEAQLTTTGNLLSPNVMRMSNVARTTLSHTMTVDTTTDNPVGNLFTAFLKMGEVAATQGIVEKGLLDVHLAKTSYFDRAGLAEFCLPVLQPFIQHAVQRAGRFKNIGSADMVRQIVATLANTLEGYIPKALLPHEAKAKEFVRIFMQIQRSLNETQKGTASHPQIRKLFVDFLLETVRTTVEHPDTFKIRPTAATESGAITASLHELTASFLEDATREPLIARLFNVVEAGASNGTIVA